MAHPRTCIIGLKSYDFLAGAPRPRYIGGIERHLPALAKGLAARGVSVSFITYDHGQPDGIEHKGVRVFTAYDREGGPPIVRFLYPRWIGLCRAMQRADADVYLQMGAECETGQAALWCRRHGRKLVYSVASDPDCDVQLPQIRTTRERVLCRYGIAKADRIIVQTRRQQDMLRTGFGKESTVIPMPCPGPTEARYVPPPAPTNGSCRVLWIGRICEVKRPDLLLELAKLCPDMVFDLVGPVADSAYAKAVFERARQIANIAAHGPVTRDRVPEFYRRASCMCCTSAFEGFPNTFLEAWSHGLPIVSTFDPDGLVVGRGLGAVAEDVPALAAALRRLFGRPENHTVEAVMPKFERVLLEVAGRASTGEEKH